MEYQKIMNFADNTPFQLSNFRATICVEITDEPRGTYNTNSQIKFKNSVLMSSLCDYNGGYIHAKGSITIQNIGTAEALNKRTKKVIFKNCAPLTD